MGVLLFVCATHVDYLSRFCGWQLFCGDDFGFCVWVLVDHVSLTFDFLVGLLCAWWFALLDLLDFLWNKIRWVVLGLMLWIV